MWNIAICDDDSISLDINKEFLNKYLSDNKTSARISCFSSPEALLESVRKEGFYDLYILDMIMDKLNGLQLGEALRNEGSNGQIIYISSSGDYVFDAFSVDAMYYILKPVDYDKFSDAVVRAFRKMDGHGQTILVKSGTRKVRISKDKLLCVDMEDHVLCYHLSDGSKIKGKTVRTSFKNEVKELSGDPVFAQVGSGLMVNLKLIDSVTSSSVVFTCGETIYPPTRSIPELIEIWNNFYKN